MPNRIKIYRQKETPAELKDIERNLINKGYNHIAGTDEAGRGPLAGPVVAAAVIIPKNIAIPDLDDSKKLTRRQREKLFDEIAVSGAFCSVGVIDNETIDRINILKASLLAMRKAIMSLEVNPDFILVDGSFTIPNLTVPQMALIGGDAVCRSISAASIIAKVTRDRIMDRYQEIYPDYSFANHRGYPTKRHLDELKNFGPTVIHRKSFRPVEKLLNKSIFE
ncbi:MAG TPA: ribonuclease HII [candidate division Zixibacteria bacterium]|nr:ribonuclease HII [candidate division Zixibacteria bacterium]